MKAMRSALSVLGLAAGLLAALWGGASFASGVTAVFQYDAAGNLTRVADVSSDTSNCGGIGAVCSPSNACCAGECADLATSASNCGACGRVCTSEGVNTVGTCAAAVCGSACAAGWGDCTPDAGCETSLRTVANCGDCGVPCSTANITASCTSGTCDGACLGGWADCNANKQSDGCETSVYSVSNCGGCGVVCSSNHITATCTAGSCSGTCETGWADCNGNKQSDGCETSVYSVSNCGGCGVVCSSNHITAACTAGSCNGTCAAGWADCNGKVKSRFLCKTDSR